MQDKVTRNGSTSVVGKFAFIYYISGTAGELAVSLDFPIDYHGYRLYSGGIENKVIGKNEKLFTAPILLDGCRIDFILNDKVVLTTECEIAIKTENMKLGVLRVK